jgi:hypothetical protein
LPGKIVRINPATSEVFTHDFSGNGPAEMVFSGGYIFVGTFRSPASVFKLKLEVDTRLRLIKSFRAGSYSTGKCVSRKRVTL